MAKDPSKKSLKRKPRRAREQEPRALRIKIKRRGIKDVELAIKKKLDAEPTDLFRNSDTLIIVLEDEGT
jgi:hypothetical protein